MDELMPHDLTAHEKQRTASRRNFLKATGSISLLPLVGGASPLSAQPVAGSAPPPFRRIRPSDPGWPSAKSWERLRGRLRGELIKVESPLKACTGASGGSCDRLFSELKNPYFIGDHAGLTQTLGWVDAWTTQPSAFAVAAQGADDVAAAVNFARENRLRLVVKGGGHSYFGNSNAPDSLLIWTRRMNAITLHDTFVGEGCSGQMPPRPAVSVGAGCIWMHVYEAVMAKAGRYVQGGGCATVGVAGLIQSGGFGSFSKAFGAAAGGLLEAEIVTADGKILLANACTNADLFWGLKGGGGGSLGVVTRLTLETHELPSTLGGCFVTVKADNDPVFRDLVGRTIGFYAESLFNPHWGEKITIRGDRTVAFAMVFQGLSEIEARQVWQPFFEWIGRTSGLSMVEAPRIIAVSGRRFFDPVALTSIPGVVVADDRPGASPANVFWSGDQGEAGQFLYAYQSAWLPATLLEHGRQESLVNTLCAAVRHISVALHCNKGFAGAPAAAVTRSRDTAMNPVALDAFALVIASSNGQPAYPGIAGREPDVTMARARAASVDQAMQEIYSLVPKSRTGAYVSESNYFDRDWQQSYWGGNYPRLLAIKRKYDPDGLFFVHNGVGVEDWSDNGFIRKP